MSGETVIGREPCPSCGSSDNLARYDDGHAYCFGFGCEHYEPAEGGSQSPRNSSERKRVTANFLRGEAQELRIRRIRRETCEKFGYRIAKDDSGALVQAADYRDSDGQLIAQKVRTADKKFRVIGQINDAQLFGQHLWRQGGGKRIVVTEGEIDALSVAQVMNLSWPVVSIPLGAQGAKKALARQLEFLESFEQIVLMFDMDEPGTLSAAECSELFTPGKCAIASLPLKDPNEMLKAGRVKELVSAIWEAQVRRPDGIVNGSELWDLVSAEQEPGLPYPWEGLNKLTYGQFKGTIVTWCSGTGMGKSEFVAQAAYDDAMRHGKTIGYVGLEEGLRRSGLRMVSQHLGRRLHLPGHGVPMDEVRKGFDATLATGKFFFMDHFGSLDSDNLLSKLRYLIKGCGCEIVVLDHISIVVSGADDGDERKAIDVLMTNLRSLVEETGATIHAVSHLKRPLGKGHEDGGQVSLAQLRGSGGIGQLSDVVIGVERNKQDPDPLRRCTSLLRVIKNRLSGDEGLAAAVRFDKATGKLVEVPFIEKEDGSVEFDATEEFGEADDRSDDF